MATIKSFTSQEQSKKLAEILPLESADMHFVNYKHAGCVPYLEMTDGSNPWLKGTNISPCWSLPALLDVLPNSLIYTPNPTLDGYCCKNIMHDLETYGDNPVDACVSMIEKLHELKML